MEEEAREILKAALTAERASKLNLADSIRRHVTPLGGVELALRAARSRSQRSDTHEVIVLGTNVLTEVLKPLPSEIVLRWLAAQELAAVFTTAITQAEVLYRYRGLASGQARRTIIGGHRTDVCRRVSEIEVTDD